MTIARSVLHQFYLKMQIEVSIILLTTKANLGKFTVARPFFLKKICTKKGNFKMSARF